MKNLNFEDEPVRLTGWYALIVGLVVEVGLLWSFDTPLKAIVAAVLVTITTRIGGIEWARQHAYAPSTVGALAFEAAEGLGEGDDSGGI